VNSGLLNRCSRTTAGQPRTTLALKYLKACNCSARTWRSYTIPTTPRESERRHRELFESMIEAYCVIEMISPRTAVPSTSPMWRPTRHSSGTPCGRCWASGSRRSSRTSSSSRPTPCHAGRYRSGFGAFPSSSRSTLRSLAVNSPPLWIRRCWPPDFGGRLPRAGDYFRKRRSPRRLTHCMAGLLGLERPLRTSSRSLSLRQPVSRGAWSHLVPHAERAPASAGATGLAPPVVAGGAGGVYERAAPPAGRHRGRHPVRRRVIDTE
jgi:hypothetical protein